MYANHLKVSFTLITNINKGALGTLVSTQVKLQQQVQQLPQ